MCKCEEKKLARILAAGEDLVVAIEKASWGTIQHPTLHMTEAIITWRGLTCKPKSTE